MMDKLDSNGRSWKSTKVYHLRDLATEPQWEAKLLVFTKDIQHLGGFSLNFLSTTNIEAAKAWNWEDDVVYSFTREHPGSPGQGVNAIYDQMPLDGWWPWPKAPGPGSR